jgi:hypothetical protein
VRRLSRRLPLDRPVEVRVVRRIRADANAEGGGWGQCDLRDGRYVIWVTRWRCPGVMRETLAHEWAHARRWRSMAAKAHHDEWGREYARAYRVAIGD